MKNMGGMMSMLDKLPGAKNLPDHIKNKVDDKMFSKMEAMINSMTLKERANPEIIKGSRRRRIAMGFRYASARCE
ncbi:signal recognition particle protein [Pasteurella multocida subsp. multocida str. Anand1_cattle]|nr:signal recognition particle protein [Pasteurella multocida subsp. multocida str. Anand1_cattle]